MYRERALKWVVIVSGLLFSGWHLSTGHVLMVLATRR